MKKDYLNDEVFKEMNKSIVRIEHMTDRMKHRSEQFKRYHTSLNFDKPGASPVER